MPRCELSDAQKGDLSKIWDKFAEGISPHQLSDGQDSGPPSSYGETVNSASMDDHTYELIVRLYFFLNHVVSSACLDHQRLFSDGKDDVFEKKDVSPTFESVQHLFVFQRQPGNDATDTIFLPKPCYISSTQPITIWFNHASFLHELGSFESRSSHSRHDNDSSSFGPFLYHRPEAALLALNCSIGLLSITYYRKNQGLDTTQQILSPNAGVAPMVPIVSRFFHVYPQLPLKDMKTSNVAKFISVQGHVIRARPKRLRVLHVQVTCTKCAEQWKIYFYEGRYVAPSRCANRQCRMKGGNAWRIVKTTASYVDFQDLKIQEIQEDTVEDGGRTPRTLDIEVTTADLVDICTAGDTIQVSGILKAVNTAMASGRSNKKVMQETSTYKIYLAANCIINTTKNNFESRKRLKRNKEETVGSGKGSGGTSSLYTSEQLETITKVAYADHMCGPMNVRMAFPFDLLVRSICPAIIGHDMVKAGILLALLGGTPTNNGSTWDGRYGNRIRSNIHILVVGDPGMGKSQMLLAASHVAARSVYIGGNTSSTGGLTVSLTKEPGGEIGIEAGALVIADQGVCCIDEFDKMSKALQDGLLEAMEQQQLSVAKAGLIASLPARCSIIAAANPETGKYNRNKTVSENLNISKPLLSRFDVIYILEDRANEDQDSHVATSIMRNFRRPEGDVNQVKLNNYVHGTCSQSDIISLIDRLRWINDTQKPLPSPVLKDYISYAREYCKPKLTPDAADILKQYFMSLRYPAHGMDRSQSIPITTRQLEALIRLSQARAKACLRDFVLKEDAEDVIELMRASVNQIHMRDDGCLDRSRGGASGRSKRKPKAILLDALRKSHQSKFSFADIEMIAGRCGIASSELKQIVDELRNEDPPKILKSGQVYRII